MPNIRRLFACALLIALPLSAAATRVYKSTAPDGSTVYSDQPSPQATEIDVPPSAAERTRRAIAATLAAILGTATPCRITAGTIRRQPGAKFRPIRSLAGARA